jgi:hypothetical protein
MPVDQASSRLERSTCMRNNERRIEGRLGLHMKRTYELKMALVIDEDRRQAIIDEARRVYKEAGGAFYVDDGTDDPIPAEEAIETVDDALMELMHTHPAFEAEGIELIEMSCDVEEKADLDTESSGESSELRPPPSAAANAEEIPRGLNAAKCAEDLDDYEADAYLCRWPNGDFSVVSACSKREAIIALDEWAGAHPSQVQPLDGFKADFRLTDEGEIILREFGEEAGNVIWDTCYTELRDLLSSDEVTDTEGNVKPGGRERIAKAVEQERTRLWKDQPKDTPRTELGKRIAQQMGTSAVVADHYVEKNAKRILESDEGEDGKPN